MNKELDLIRQKVSSIMFGILRYQTKSGHISWQVRAVPGEGDLLHCILADDAHYKKMLNKNINLIQKNKDDYLFITGKVLAETHQNNTILSIRVSKASWFERCSNNFTSWLEEKHVYENYRRESLKAAS